MQADLKMIQMTLRRAQDHILAQAPPNLEIMQALDDAWKTADILMRDNPDKGGIDTNYDAGTSYTEPATDDLSKALEQSDAEIPVQE